MELFLGIGGAILLVTILILTLNHFNERRFRPVTLRMQIQGRYYHGAPGDVAHMNVEVGGAQVSRPRKDGDWLGVDIKSFPSTARPQAVIVVRTFDYLQNPKHVYRDESVVVPLETLLGVRTGDVIELTGNYHPIRGDLRLRVA